MGVTLFAATLALTQLLLPAAIIGQAILSSTRQVRRREGEVMDCHPKVSE